MRSEGEKTVESYYLRKPEPYQSCLLALRHLILNIDPGIVTERKYQIPFFLYKGKKLGYLWLNGRKLMLGFCIDKTVQEPISGIKTKDLYESIRIDPNEDLPIDLIIKRISKLIDNINLYQP